MTTDPDNPIERVHTALVQALHGVATVPDGEREQSDLPTVSITKLPLWERKQHLRQRWANSKAADAMNVLEFSRFMVALETAKSHADVDGLAKRWREMENH